MTTPSTATYALLGLLAVQSWTGYELTQQARRSLRYAWPTSEAHLYREQQRLVHLGWATVDNELVGKRHRNRYTITPQGRHAFSQWLTTEPAHPRIDVEAILRIFFADHGSVDDLRATLLDTAQQARASIDEMLDYAQEFLTTGGRFPERLHLIGLAAELVTDLLAQIETFCQDAAAEVELWTSTKNLGLTDTTRARLERLLTKYRQPDSDHQEAVD